jgi:hypothetical protein
MNNEVGDKARIFRWVEERHGELCELIAEICQIPSPSGSESAKANFI